MQPEDRPLASPQDEELARGAFPFETMTPEEYAARHGADWACFSMDERRYRDARLDAWVQRLGQIFVTPGLMQHYQETLLTPEELREVRERMEDPF